MSDDEDLRGTPDSPVLGQPNPTAALTNGDEAFLLDDDTDMKLAAASSKKRKDQASAPAASSAGAPSKRTAVVNAVGQPSSPSIANGAASAAAPEDAQDAEEPNEVNQVVAAQEAIQLASSAFNSFDPNSELRKNPRYFRNIDIEKDLDFHCKQFPAQNGKEGNFSIRISNRKLNDYSALICSPFTSVGFPKLFPFGNWARYWPNEPADHKKENILEAKYVAQLTNQPWNPKLPTTADKKDPEMEAWFEFCIKLRNIAINKVITTTEWEDTKQDPIAHWRQQAITNAKKRSVAFKAMKLQHDKDNGVALSRPEERFLEQATQPELLLAGMPTPPSVEVDRALRAMVLPGVKIVVDKKTQAVKYTQQGIGGKVFRQLSMKELEMVEKGKKKLPALNRIIDEVQRKCGWVYNEIKLRDVSTMTEIPFANRSISSNDVCAVWMQPTVYLDTPQEQKMGVSWHPVQLDFYRRGIPFGGSVHDTIANEKVKPIPHGESFASGQLAITNTQADDQADMAAIMQLIAAAPRAICAAPAPASASSSSSSSNGPIITEHN